MSKALLHLAHKHKSRHNNPDEMRYDIYLSEMKKKEPDTKVMSKKQFDEAYERLIDTDHQFQVNPKIKEAIHKKLHELYPKLIGKDYSMYKIRQLTHEQFEEEGYDPKEAVKLVEKYEDQDLHRARLINSIDFRNGGHLGIIHTIMKKTEDTKPMEYIKKHEKDYMKQAVNLRDKHGIYTRPPKPISQI